MQRELSLKIKHCGHETGTVGWLAESARAIHLAQTKNGKLGAWLVDETGKTITCLAIRDFWDLSERRTDIETIANDRSGQFGCGSDQIPWTDAAWTAVCALGEEAKGLIEAKLAEDDGVPYTFKVCRIK